MIAFTFTVLLFGVLFGLLATMLGMLGTYDGSPNRVLPVGLIVLFLCLVGMFQMAGIS